MSKIRLPIVCQHCGSSNGIYQQLKIEQYYDAYGKAFYSSDPVAEGKILYCIDCHKPVCRLSTFMKLTSGQNN